MIIQLENDVDGESKRNIIDKVQSAGYKTTEVKTQEGYYVVGIGEGDFDIRAIGNLKGVKDIHRVSDNYKMVSRKWKIETTMIDLGDGIVINDENFAIMAGPCSIENESQVKNTIEHLKKHGIKIMRGGVFKPRSSPYSFRGLGIDGLKMFYRMTSENNIKIISEVMQVSQIDEMYDYVDIFQVGARNTQNYNLLDALGKVDKPIMIKRGISGTIDELLYSAEYVFSSGNEKLLICERGIRSFEPTYRNVLDLNAIPILKEKTHLPVIVDPSHGIGIRDYVESMALAGVMAGADGVIVEIHEKPEEALSDGQQSLNFIESAKLFKKLGKTINLRNSF